MQSDIEKNVEFLTNIYVKGTFSRHGFCAQAEKTFIKDMPNGDYTLSQKPVAEWVPI